MQTPEKARQTLWALVRNFEKVWWKCTLPQTVLGGATCTGFSCEFAPRFPIPKAMINCKRSPCWADGHRDAKGEISGDHVKRHEIRSPPEEKGSAAAEKSRVSTSKKNSGKSRVGCSAVFGKHMVQYICRIWLNRQRLLKMFLRMFKRSCSGKCFSGKCFCGKCMKILEKVGKDAQSALRMTTNV